MHLNATEWVKKGTQIITTATLEGKPICQGKLPDTFETDIAQAFDEGYQKAPDALEKLETEYTAKMSALIELFKNNLTAVLPKVKTADYEKLVWLSLRRLLLKTSSHSEEAYSTGRAS